MNKPIVRDVLRTNVILTGPPRSGKTYKACTILLAELLVSQVAGTNLPCAVFYTCYESLENTVLANIQRSLALEFPFEEVEISKPITRMSKVLEITDQDALHPYFIYFFDMSSEVHRGKWLGMNFAASMFVSLGAINKDLFALISARSDTVIQVALEPKTT